MERCSSSSILHLRFLLQRGTHIQSELFSAVAMVTAADLTSLINRQFGSLTSAEERSCRAKRKLGSSSSLEPSSASVAGGRFSGGVIH